MSDEMQDKEFEKLLVLVKAGRWKGERLVSECCAEWVWLSY